MIRESITKLIHGEDLPQEEMRSTMGAVFEGKATAGQIAALATALRLKGETVEEITGAAMALRERAVRFNPGNSLLNLDRDDINLEGETILETSDAGRQGTSIFNISTATAFVVAGAGLKVARHGSRSESIYFGAAEVLASLGVNLDISFSDVERCVQQVGIGFMFTPMLQGPMRHVARVREEMGIRTIFNLIGPLMHPTGASAHVLGVYDPALTEKMTRVLVNLGASDAVVVYGESTLDEVSICGPSHISRLVKGDVETFIVQPEDFGLQRAEPKTIHGGNSHENAEIIRRVLDGQPGPCKDVVVLNAAAAFVAAGLDADLKNGARRAAQVIDGAKAKGKLEALVEFTGRCTPFVRKEL